jgi:hypothetical protein
MDIFSDIKMPSSERLTELAERRAREKGTDYRSALIEVAAENRLLAESARREALHGASSQVVPGMFVNRPHSWELHKRARARAGERLIPFPDARRQIELEDPELAERARSEGGMNIQDTEPLPGGGEIYVCATEFGLTRNPSGLLAFVTGNRARHKGIGYRAALSEVCADYPRLAAAARQFDSR